MYLRNVYLVGTTVLGRKKCLTLNTSLKGFNQTREFFVNKIINKQGDFIATLIFLCTMSA